VEQLLRPTGFFRQKARAVRGIARLVVERHGGSLKAPLRWPTGRLRKELLSWPGVGPETADAILLYVARRPVFVVDAYARRLMVRYGAASPTAKHSYAAVHRAWQGVVPSTARAHARLHGAIVDLCKSHCRTRPRCGDCPLSPGCRRATVPKERRAQGSLRAGPP
jgi:endonuclease-3 related protein